MRLVVPVAALLIALLSLSLDLFPSSLASPLCLHGCRFDQMVGAANAAGATPEALSILANADPANPLVWCTYAEIQSANGKPEKAKSAFDHAISLGPGMPAVLMRAANYDFTHGRQDQGLLLSARILSQTNIFNEILFFYLLGSGVPTRALLGTAIPTGLRPAQAWLAWLPSHGSVQDLGDTWKWMKGNGLLDEKSADEVAWALWDRGSYGMSYALWRDWVGSAELLANAGFETAPRASPFDWRIASSPAATVTRTNGLEIRFAGTDNVTFGEVGQFTVAPEGRYRFCAEVASENVTTDQRPFFRIFDPVQPGRLSVRTGAVEGTSARSKVTVDFTVMGKPEPLVVELERWRSQNFDNRIAGTFHVYRVSLVRLP
jgi:hypothetical protein